MSTMQNNGRSSLIVRSHAYILYFRIVLLLTLASLSLCISTLESDPNPSDLHTSKETTEDSSREVDLISDLARHKATGSTRVVCYYASWATYRAGKAKFPINKIDPFMCTHIIYSFAGLSTEYEIKSLDGWNDFARPKGLDSLKRMVGFKKVNPKLKAMIAVGGWNEGSKNYSDMATNRVGRGIFVKSVVNFLDENNLDGLDVDWEYPTQRGGRAEDKQNFVLLLKELREAFLGSGYILTVAISAGHNIIESSYNLPSIAKSVDFINLLSYDYHGKWETKTGINAPLYRSIDDDWGGENINATVYNLIGKGVPRDKIVVGLAFYGNSFTLSSKSEFDLGAPASGPGKPGRYTKSNGTLSYLEVCLALKEEAGFWKLLRNPGDDTPFAHNEDQWISFDDERSIKIKVDYVIAMKLGGVMVWSIDQDDFEGTCHGEPFPLFNAIKQAIELGQSSSTIGSDTDRETSSTTSTTGKSTIAEITTETPTEPSTDSPDNDNPKMPECGRGGRWYFPGPICRQYYDCHTMTPILMECPKGMLWHQSIRKCDVTADPDSGCNHSISITIKLDGRL